MFGLALLFVCVFLLSFSILITLLGMRELVFVLIVHLFVSYAHVNLCHFFSSSWCQGLAATSACGSSWTFLFTSWFHVFWVSLIILLYYPFVLSFKLRLF